MLRGGYAGLDMRLSNSKARRGNRDRKPIATFGYRHPDTSVEPVPESKNNLMLKSRKLMA